MEPELSETACAASIAALNIAFDPTEYWPTSVPSTAASYFVFAIVIAFISASLLTWVLLPLLLLLWWDLPLLVVLVELLCSLVVVVFDLLLSDVLSLLPWVLVSATLTPFELNVLVGTKSEPIASPLCANVWVVPFIVMSPTLIAPVVSSK